MLETAQEYKTWVTAFGTSQDGDDKEGDTGQLSSGSLDFRLCPILGMQKETPFIESEQ